MEHSDMDIKTKCFRERLNPPATCPFPDGKAGLACKKLKLPPSKYTLSELVDIYLGDWRCHLCVWLTGFSTLDFHEAVKYAADGRESDGKLKICHFKRIKIEDLADGRIALLKQQRKLSRCKSFDELYEKIENLIESVPVSGLGPMYVYDVALRIGASKGLLPDRVYLQCGAREGARELGLAHTSQTIALADLPLELRRRLTAYEIEDFLCIFKKHLKKKPLQQINEAYEYLSS